MRTYIHIYVHMYIQSYVHTWRDVCRQVSHQFPTFGTRKKAGVMSGWPQKDGEKEGSQTTARLLLWVMKCSNEGERWWQCVGKIRAPISDVSFNLSWTGPSVEIPNRNLEMRKKPRSLCLCHFILFCALKEKYFLALWVEQLDASSPFLLSSAGEWLIITSYPSAGSLPQRKGALGFRANTLEEKMSNFITGLIPHFELELLSGNARSGLNHIKIALKNPIIQIVLTEVGIFEDVSHKC